MAKNSQSKKVVSQVGMAGGAAAGAAAGAMLGPVGAAIGAVVGGVAGSRSGISLDGNTMEKVKSKVVAPTKRALSKVSVQATNGKKGSQKAASKRSVSSSGSKPSPSKSTGTRKSKKTKAKTK